MIESRNNYVGEYDLETKKKHGQGTYLYKNSFFQYSGEWDQNVKNGNGVLLMKDGSKFEGEFKDGEINGYGVREWRDGRIYKGQFLNGEKHGHGDYSTPYGERYIGEWSFNQRHGQGELRDDNGNQYIGTFNNHKPHGKCKITYKDGSVFEGMMQEGKKNEYGELFLKQEKIGYKGDWLNDKRHGQGVLTNIKTNYSYAGNWINDAPEILPNQIVLTFPDDQIKEFDRVFEESKADKKRNKKPGDEEEKFKFTFPESLDYEVGGPKLKSFEIHFKYQGPDVEDPNQPSKEEIEELIRQYQKEVKKAKNPPPMPDYSKPKMTSVLPVLIENETGKKVKIQLVKYEDQTKKGSLEKENFKTFRFDYREKMQIKREENQRLKEEIAKQLEEEAKLAESPKKVPAGKKKEIKKKEEPKSDIDLNKINLYQENEDEKEKIFIASSEQGKIKIEGIEFPDDFPPGTYTFLITDLPEPGAPVLSHIYFDLNIISNGLQDKSKQKKK